MTVPYRTQRVLKRITLVLLAVAVVLAAVWCCWNIWVQRYVVYGADGSVRLDFNLQPLQPGTPAVRPETPDISIRFDQNDALVGGATELTQMNGYYIELSDLQDMGALKNQLLTLPAGTAVMVDVKNIQGAFYYSSSVSSTRSNQLNIEQFDDLLATMKDSHLYTIARLPALRDYTYGLNHVPDGVHHSSGGYLYMDDAGCYWLHPGSQGTLSYLTQIIMELKSLGFDEVVLDDFRFPDTTSILVNADQAELLTQAAATLYAACATDTFAVSFMKTVDFTVPEGRCRMYVPGSDASQAAGIAAGSGVSDTAVKLVFFTELHDTRFDAYSVMRPISGAH